MSTSHRRIQVDVVGNVGGFNAAMNSVLATTTRVGAGFRRSSRDASLLSNQMKAIGTTARYYIAGQLIFGVAAGIRKLGEFKTQLGQVDALAAQLNKKGELVGLGKQLDDVGSQAILMSNKFGIAVGDVQSYMQRFFSSFDPPGGSKQRIQEMSVYTTALLNLSTAIGTEAGDPGKLAGGLTGLINAMPGGRKSPGKTAGDVADMFAVLLRNTPALTGADIASAAGRMASAKSLAKMSVPEIMSAFGVAAQTGGSPAVMIRGMTQLLGASLLRPTKPESLATYQAAGLPTDPNALAAMGGQKVLEKLVQFVEGGKRGKDKENFNLTAVYKAFSRQESVRQFVNLLAQDGVKGLRDFKKSLDEGTKGNMAKKMADQRLKQSTLLRMDAARSNLGLSLVGGANWPLEHLLADPIIAVSNAAAKHRTTTQAVMGGALSLGAASALRRLGVFSNLGGKFGKLGKGVGLLGAAQRTAIGGALTTEALPGAIAGLAVDGSRGNPFWVIIHPLSWSVGSPGGLSQPIGDSPLLGKKSMFNKYGKYAPMAGAMAALVASPIVAQEIAQVFAKDDVSSGKARGLSSGFPLLSKFAKSIRGSGMSGSFFQDHPSTAQQQILDAYTKRYISAQTAESRLAKLEGTLDVTMKLTDEQGRNLGKATVRGVPVKLWNAKQFPTAKGKPGSRKGGR